MNDNDENVWITGIGLLSCLGAGAEQHFNALMNSEKANIDEQTYAPYPMHTLNDVNWEDQIPKRDMRQMGAWQQIGTYAAGLALEDAGFKKDDGLGDTTDMIISARGSACDVDVSREILKITDEKNDEDAQPIITQYLSDNLRPTLFLTQLPNLLAGNISIVHKITGSSRTLMGEEGAGVSAIKTAHARIAKGQSEIILVGGAFNSECLETLLSMELGSCLHNGSFEPIRKRMKDDKNGLILGTVGAFVVMESQSHAEKRKAHGYCVVEKINSDSGNRNIKDVIKGQASMVLSGASGASSVTENEMKILDEAKMPVRAYGSRTGHAMEAQFPMGVALGALAIKHNRCYPKFEDDEMEFAKGINNGDVDNVMVTTIGAWHGEGMAMLRKIEGA